MKILADIEFDIVKDYQSLYQQSYTEFKNFIIKYKDVIRKSIHERLVKGDYNNLKYSFDLYKAMAEHLNLENVDIITSKQLSLQVIINKLNKEFFDEDIFLESITRRETRYFSAIDFNFKTSLKFEERFKNLIDRIVLK